MGNTYSSDSGRHGFGSGGLNFNLFEAVDGLREQFGQKVGARMGRGDVRTAILALLLEKPMHGYQIIQEIEERSGGSWKPSAGSVYPTLQLLADEGLVESEEVGEKKTYSLTATGREAAEVAAEGDLPWNTSLLRDAGRMTALPKAGAKLAEAVVQVTRSGNQEQVDKAVAIIDDARRRIYSLLAEG